MDPNITHVADYWNGGGRGLGDAPNVLDAVNLQYARPTFPLNVPGAAGDIPEPCTMVLAGLALAAAGGYAGRRRKA